MRFLYFLFVVFLTTLTFADSRLPVYVPTAFTGSTNSLTNAVITDTRFPTFDTNVYTNVFSYHLGTPTNAELLLTVYTNVATNIAVVITNVWGFGTNTITNIITRTNTTYPIPNREILLDPAKLTTPGYVLTIISNPNTNNPIEATNDYLYVDWRPGGIGTDDPVPFDYILGTSNDVQITGGRIVWQGYGPIDVSGSTQYILADNTYVYVWMDWVALTNGIATSATYETSNNTYYRRTIYKFDYSPGPGLSLEYNLDGKHDQQIFTVFSY